MFQEQAGQPKLVDEVCDQGEGVGILLGSFVEIAIVLTWAESSILFPNKKEWKGHGAG